MLKYSLWLFLGTEDYRWFLNFLFILCILSYKPYGKTLWTTLTTLFNHNKNNTKKSTMGTLKNHILFINISLEIINITNLYKIKQNNIYYNSYTVYHMPVVIVVQSLSHVQLFTTPWTAAHQASLSFTISQSLFKFMSIASVMQSNRLILSHPLLLVL